MEDEVGVPGDVEVLNGAGRPRRGGGAGSTVICWGHLHFNAVLSAVMLSRMTAA